jgi:hypothetical protein
MAQTIIVHTTECLYRNPVRLLRHKPMVRPGESHDLRLHSATLKVEPKRPASTGSMTYSTIPSVSWNGPKHSERSSSASYRRST